LNYFSAGKGALAWGWDSRGRKPFRPKRRETRVFPWEAEQQGLFECAKENKFEDFLGGG
jgi:hypothetical protein